MMMSNIASSGIIIDKIHRLPIRIYYEDTDMSGIVYHANYLRYFERGRTDFLRCAGIIHTELQQREKPLAFAVIKADIDFKKAARIDNNLIINSNFHSISGAKLNIKQWIMRDEEVITTADITAVMIDMFGNPQRPPKDLIEKLEVYTKK